VRLLRQDTNYAWEMTKEHFNKWISEKASSVAFENRQVSKKGDVFNMLWMINLYYEIRVCNA